MTNMNLYESLAITVFFPLRQELKESADGCRQLAGISGRTDIFTKQNNASVFFAAASQASKTVH